VTTPPDEYQVDLYISVEHDIRSNPQGIINKVIPSGRCVITRHIGSRESIHVATSLYEEWFPESGEKLWDYPIFFHCINVGPNVQKHEMITDVYLPLV